MFLEMIQSSWAASEILFLHGHQQAGDDHQGRRAVPEVQRPGEVLEEVPAVEEHLAVARGRGQEVQADEREPDERQGAGAFPAQEPGHGPEQVGPSDQPEDAPPAGPEETAVLGAVGEGEADEQDDSRRPEPFPGPELFRPGVPDEEEAQHHQQDEEPLPTAHPGGHAAFGIDDEHAHHQQGEGPGEDVAEGFPSGSGARWRRGWTGPRQTGTAGRRCPPGPWHPRASPRAPASGARPRPSRGRSRRSSGTS